MEHSDAAQHVNQAGGMFDFLTDAHAFFPEKRTFGEATRGGQTLNQVTAANHREHRGGAEAFVA